jgi:hypothetical protein
MANKLRDVAKELRWREALRRFAHSGLGVRAFCRRAALPESAFYFWRRELARRETAVSAAAKPGRRQSPAFVPALVTGPLGPEGLSLELAGGRVLRLPADISAARLAELILALEAASRAAEAQR